MPTYQAHVSRLEREQSLKGGQLLDERRQKFEEIQKLTGRPLIVYFANFTRGGNIPGNSIDDSDITAFSDLLENVPGTDLDIMLHTPGGIVESAERIVAMLRGRFTSVRYVISHTAYSAGTLMAFSGDSILMDDRSTLGPVDPQLLFRDPNTGEFQAVPAQAITAGFQRAQVALKNPAPEILKSYLPMLNKLNLHLLEICNNATALTYKLSQELLTRYMFKGEEGAAAKAESIAKFFSSHETTLSHRRGINIDKAQEQGLKIIDMREDPKLRQALWQLHCAVEFFVDSTGDTTKFYENAYGVSWRRRFQTLVGPLTPQVKQRPGGGKR